MNIFGIFVGNKLDLFYDCQVLVFDVLEFVDEIGCKFYEVLVVDWIQVVDIDVMF